MELPLLGMGTWGMGGTFEKDPSNFDASIESLRFGFELGLRLIDVAELHGGGLTEEIVGEAIKGYKREEMHIISKVSRDHLKHDDVLRAIEGSLKRLGTDYIDLYLIHKLPPGMTEPPAETFEALERLLREGLVRHIGVSNFTPAQIEKAESYLTESRLEANEIEYNLLYQGQQKETIPFSKARGMKLIAHRPLAKGLLGNTEHETLKTLSRKYGKSPVQIALNWILSQDITAIPKASSKEHLKENIGALGWKLSDEDIALLRALAGSLPYEKIKQ
ncbi:MAG: aldo/keto reductase [bacterium]|nr:aldo/keto reductase [bacterium]